MFIEWPLVLGQIHKQKEKFYKIACWRFIADFFAKENFFWIKEKNNIYKESIFFCALRVINNHYLLQVVSKYGKNSTERLKFFVALYIILWFYTTTTEFTISYVCVDPLRKLFLSGKNNLGDVTIEG